MKIQIFFLNFALLFLINALVNVNIDKGLIYREKQSSSTKTKREIMYELHGFLYQTNKANFSSISIGHQNQA